MESKIHRRYPVGSAKRRTLRSTLRCVQVLLRCTMPSARELILEGKAEPGDTVDLLWRNELQNPFTSRITFDAAGKAVSGPCTATRIEGGWRSAAAPEPRRLRLTFVCRARTILRQHCVDKRNFDVCRFLSAFFHAACTPVHAINRAHSVAHPSPSQASAVSLLLR